MRRWRTKALCWLFLCVSVWGYSLAFATLIGIVSNIGAFLVPIMNTTYYKLVLMFMVALAVGCMTGTSLFVLMPEVGRPEFNTFLTWAVS